MSILIGKNTRVVTQGITGTAGQIHTRASRAYANGKEAYVAGARLQAFDQRRRRGIPDQLEFDLDVIRQRLRDLHNHRAGAVLQMLDALAAPESRLASGRLATGPRVAVCDRRLGPRGWLAGRRASACRGWCASAG